MFFDMEYDVFFVDLVIGKLLKFIYLKNYIKKVINGSKYCEILRYLINYFFCYRFIIFNIVKVIKKILV